MKRLNALLIAASRAFIAGVFLLATRLTKNVKVAGLAYDTGASQAYLGMSHKRDLDPVVLIPSIIFHRGWRAVAGDVHFVLRGDAFSPGFLARIVMTPRWLSFLLRFVPIDHAISWLGTFPADSLLRPTEEWIREIMRVEGNAGNKRDENKGAGEKLVGDVLAPSLIEEIAAAARESYQHVASLPISRLLAWKYQRVLQHVHGSEILIGATRHPVQQRTVAGIKEHMAELDDWLWRGGSLFGSIEGQLSPYGLLSQVNGGFHRLMRTAPPGTSVVPVFLIYDFMSRQRLRIFIDLAPPIERVPSLSPAEFEEQLRARWLEAARFTCTQLASGFLVHASYAGLSSFTVDDLADNIHNQAKSLAQAGRHVDERLLDPVGARERARDFLAYASRRGLVRRSRKRAWKPTVNEAPLSLRPGEVGYDRAPLTYALNELHEMLNAT